MLVSQFSRLQMWPNVPELHQVSRAKERVHRTVRGPLRIRLNVGVRKEKAWRRAVARNVRRVRREADRS